MSESAPDAKRAWVERVLGTRFISPTDRPGVAPTGKPANDDRHDFARMWADAAARWRDASDAVDGQISQLQSALKQTDDEELHEIAEFGLNGITGGTKVKLMAAIREVSSAGATVPRTLVGRARQAVAAFGDQIDSDERVDACDENPFGVAVSIRASFAPALAALETALAAAGG
jgi:hypothetical protein